MTQQGPNFDVVVVGAGPSGATAAFMLAKHGHKVCLIDKKDFPRPKLCAGLLTWKSMDLLKRVFNYSESDLIKAGIVVNTCRNYQIFLRSKPAVQRCLDFPFHLVDRKHYDDFWLRQARQAGCLVKTGHTVIKVEPHHGKVILADGSQLKAEMIVGADGIWSKVRQSTMTEKLRAQRWRRLMAATIETRIPTPNNQNKSLAAIYFGDLPWGYGWSIPGNDSQVVGIGRLLSKGKQSMARDFRHFLNTLSIDQNQIDSWQSHPMPYGNHLRRPARARVMLVGDACGLADPLLGEGIYYAHRSGELAALAIIASGLDPTQSVATYTQTLNRQVLRELRWIKLYRNLLFWGHHRRRFRGLRLFFYLMPKRVEAAVHGQLSFSKLIFPWVKPHRKL